MVGKRFRRQKLVSTQFPATPHTSFVHTLNECSAAVARWSLTDEGIGSQNAAAVILRITSAAAKLVLLPLDSTKASRLELASQYIRQYLELQEQFISDVESTEAAIDIRMRDHFESHVEKSVAELRQRLRRQLIDVLNHLYETEKASQTDFQKAGDEISEIILLSGHILADALLGVYEVAESVMRHWAISLANLGHESEYSCKFIKDISELAHSLIEVLKLSPSSHLLCDTTWTFIEYASNPQKTNHSSFDLFLWMSLWDMTSPKNQTLTNEHILGQIELLAPVWPFLLELQKDIHPTERRDILKAITDRIISAIQHFVAGDELEVFHPLGQESSVTTLPFIYLKGAYILTGMGIFGTLGKKTEQPSLKISQKSGMSSQCIVEILENGFKSASEFFLLWNANNLRAPKKCDSSSGLGQNKLGRMNLGLVVDLTECLIICERWDFLRTELNLMLASIDDLMHKDEDRTPAPQTIGSLHRLFNVQRVLNFLQIIAGPQVPRIDNQMLRKTLKKNPILTLECFNLLENTTVNELHKDAEYLQYLFSTQLKFHDQYKTCQSQNISLWSKLLRRSLSQLNKLAIELASDMNERMDDHIVDIDQSCEGVEEYISYPWLMDFMDIEHENVWFRMGHKFLDMGLRLECKMRNGYSWENAIKDSIRNPGRDKFLSKILGLNYSQIPSTYHEMSDKDLLISLKHVVLCLESQSPLPNRMECRHPSLLSLDFPPAVGCFSYHDSYAIGSTCMITSCNCIERLTEWLILQYNGVESFHQCCREGVAQRSLAAFKMPDTDYEDIFIDIGNFIEKLHQKLGLSTNMTEGVLRNWINTKSICDRAIKRVTNINGIFMDGIRSVRSMRREDDNNENRVNQLRIRKYDEMDSSDISDESTRVIDLTPECVAPKGTVELRKRISGDDLSNLILLTISEQFWPNLKTLRFGRTDQIKDSSYYYGVMCSEISQLLGKSISRYESQCPGRTLEVFYDLLQIDVSIVRSKIGVERTADENEKCAAGSLVGAENHRVGVSASGVRDSDEFEVHLNIDEWIVLKCSVDVINMHGSLDYNSLYNLLDKMSQQKIQRCLQNLKNKNVTFL